MNREFSKWLAWKLPKRVIMWCFYRVLAHATQGQYSTDSPTGMKWETIIDRWGEK